MENITSFITSIIDENLTDEDGHILSIRANVKLSQQTLNNSYQNTNIQIPSHLQELYIFTNGMDFFGINIPSIELIQIEPSCNYFCIHDWGNGDYDYITLDNKIIFCEHSLYNSIIIADSLLSWLKSVYNEIKKYGVLFHPMDLVNNDNKAAYVYLNNNKKIQ